MFSCRREKDMNNLYAVVSAHNLTDAKRVWPSAVFFVRRSATTWVVASTVRGILTYLDTRYEN